MKHADFLFVNALVLTMDKEMNRYENGALAVGGDSLLAVGEETAVRAAFQAAQVIDCQGKVLMPGLINAHTHVSMTLLRGLADDLRLDVWLMGYMMPVEREFVSPEFVRLGAQLACAELIRSGVTCFADMYYFEEEIAQATAEAGLRAVCSQTVLKFPAPDAESYEDALARGREFIQRWKGHPLIVPSIAPHAPYTCTPEILRTTAELAAEFDVPLHTHLAETALEVETMRREQGMPVIPYVKKQGLFGAKVLAAHCVHIDEGEMRTLLHAGAGVAHNPSSNLKLASGFAPVAKMLAVGLNVGIGTDGAASNNDLDMFEEIRLAALVAKASSGDPTSLPAAQALTLATRLGAQALFLGDLTGSLEVGKRADLILVDLSSLYNSPRFRRDADNPRRDAVGVERIGVRAGVARCEDDSDARVVDGFGRHVDRIVRIEAGHDVAPATVDDADVVPVLVFDDPVEAGQRAKDFDQLARAQTDQVRLRRDASIITVARVARRADDAGNVRAVPAGRVGVELIFQVQGRQIK